KFIPSPLERIFLQDILKNPLDGADKRAKRLGLTPRDASNIQNNLVDNSIIKPVVLERKKLFEITRAGSSLLEKIGFKINQDGGQGIEHRYFLDHIRMEFLQNGWMTYKEKDDMDLVVEKTDKIIALEFETGKNNTAQVKRNIEKLIKYNADLKFIVTTNQVALNKINTIISSTDFPDQDTIQLVLARDFIKSLPTNL
ncbi:hypothetical protein ACFL0Q_09475, partial [Thermodesulfobacteriota bacterium]